MDWKHEVSLDWLSERQEHITASEIRQLVPFTATGRPKKITDSDYMKIYAKKICKLTREDCLSYGAAARGHLLEPFAIDSASRLPGMPKLYHWDDVLITRPGHDIAYSPDALNVPMESEEPPTILGEIKSYGAERHLTTANTPKNKLEERWQIATAMAVSPTIETAYLILYNPEVQVADSQVYVIKYTRDELESEINTIFDVEADWLDFCKRDILDGADIFVRGMSQTTIYEIEKEIEHQQQLNPRL